MTETLAYMNDVLEKVCAHLVNKNEDGLASEQDSFIYQFGAFHEDMHTEAFIWGRQTLGYPSPTFSIASNVGSQRSLGPWPGFVKVPGGRFKLGANPDSPFIFDNEKQIKTIIRNQVLEISSYYKEEDCDFIVSSEEITFKEVLAGIKGPIKTLGAGDMEMKKGNSVAFLTYLSKFTD